MNTDLFARGILAALEADGLTVGDHVAPVVDNTETVVAPCVVLYMLPGGTVGWNADAADDEADVPFQLTSVGRVASEARWYADRAHDALAAAEIVIEGHAIQRVRRTQPAGSVDRDDDLSPPLFYAISRYSAYVFTLATGS